MKNKSVIEALVGRFLFDEATSSGNMPDVHTHDSYEIFYLTSGTRKYFINDKYFLVKTGDVVCIPPGAPHKTGGETGQRFLINFSEDFIDSYLTKEAKAVLLSFFEKQLISPTAECASLLSEVFGTIGRAYSEGDIATIIRHIFKLFTLLNDSPPAKSDGSLTVIQLNRAMQYVRENYEHITGLDDVAEVLFISKFYLCRIFSKYLEVSFNEYLLQTRLKNAAQYLKKSRLSILEISSKCGFNSSSYFGSVFKKHYNLTPLAFRKLYQEST